MVRVAPSLYSYEEGSVIYETTNKEEPNNSIPATGKKVIIPVIRKYGFLTAALIKRAINLDKHTTINVSKSLKKMQQQGEVQKYTIQFPSERQDIDVYILSSKMRQLNGSKSIFKYDMTDIPYILEHLSVSQWHISVLEGKNAREIMLFKQINSKGFIAQLPSLIECRSKLGKKINICAIPVPKGIFKKDLGKLFTNVITIDRYLAERRDRFRAYVMVLLCESLNQIDEVAGMMKEIAETKELFILYSIEIMSADDEFDPLGILYDISRSTGEFEQSIIRLR